MSMRLGSAVVIGVITASLVAGRMRSARAWRALRWRTSRCSGEAGMSTAEYAVGTIAACAFAAVLYQVVTGDSIVAALRDLITSALSSLVTKPGKAGDAGMVTAEAAVVLPVLVFVLAAALAAVSVVTAQMRCADAAREGARAAARGESEASVVQIAAASAPAGSSVSVTRNGETATVEVSAAVPLLPGLGPSIEVSDDATAALEPGLDGALSGLEHSRAGP